MHVKSCVPFAPWGQVDKSALGPKEQYHPPPLSEVTSAQKDFSTVQIKQLCRGDRMFAWLDFKDSPFLLKLARSSLYHTCFRPSLYHTCFRASLYHTCFRPPVPPYLALCLALCHTGLHCFSHTLFLSCSLFLCVSPQTLHPHFLRHQPHLLPAAVFSLAAR